METISAGDHLTHLEQHEKDLDVLAAIAELQSIQFEPRRLLADVLEILEQGLGMLRGTIMLLMPDGDELVVEAAQNIPTSSLKTPLYRPGEGIVGSVVQTGQVAIIPQVSEEPRFQNRIHNRSLDDFTEVSFLCVPIRMENSVIGTLSVDLPMQSPESLRERVRVLEITASIIAYNVRSRQTEEICRKTLQAENLRLRNALQEQLRPENIIGNSHRMREVYVMIHQVAGGETTVLIQGESGTGKELVASAIHYSSLRSQHSLVKVNCAALNENLLESELFGHEKGAFTGALYSRIGRIEEADGGTLFLDEVGEFSPSMQVKLLRVLQEREFERVGSNRTIKANVRIIAATNRDLESRVAEGLFRQDLYYRINVFPISLPPLRDRKDDILLLADHFVAKYAKKMGKEVRRISTPAINMMFAYHWPGNVRELENCIEYAVLLTTDGVIHGHHLPPTLQLPDSAEITTQGSLKARVDMLERDMITDALKSSHGNVKTVAQNLGITSRMIRYKMKKLGIDRRQFTKSRDQ